MDLVILAAVAGAALLPVAARVGVELAWFAMRASRSTGPRLSGAVVLAAAVAGLARPASAARPPVSVTLEPPAHAQPEAGAPEAAGTAPAVTGSYVVRPGDSLWAIACRHLRATTGSEPDDARVEATWRAIYDANRSLIGPDPNLIHPGQRLEIDL